ncbi:MAG TPA: aromatic amino acid aminotransferase [Planctomycetaceae bacterium]|nr:aromatic amino acid aminotransferase [Planctomycetaceae bacterium]|tara:strand:- start:588 stop:1778 length:1191 start_codon:yes stop_codon:yes gene_type:complete
MFQQLEAAPPDAILGLNEAFARDTTEGKINLTTGVYKDSTGTTPVLECVKEAERRLVETETSKGYLGIDGMKEFGDAARGLLFGTDHEINTSGRAATIQAPGGTGALRVAAEFLATGFPGARIWCSRPTWANHPNIFRAAGLEVAEYGYYDESTRGLDAEALFDSLSQIPAGDVVCLHACCHNPTGVDPSAEQWQQVGDLIAERGLLPLVDFAYQGFGNGLDDDAAGLRALARPGSRLLVASSFSKNFGLYRERVGALSVVTGSPETAAVVLSRLKRTIRCNYSNPPAHGAGIVTTILGDEQLRAGWVTELSEMRTRINDMRQALAHGLAEAAPGQDFSVITRQRGMFSFSGLTPEQVDRLKDEFGVYMVRNGRINVAGITNDNVARLCESIAAVV